MSIEDKLSLIEIGQKQKINGTIVENIGGLYKIAGKAHDVNSAIKKLSESKEHNIAYIMISPPSKIEGIYKVNSTAEHTKLITVAIQRNCVLYYADYEIKNGKICVKQPYIVDWEFIEKKESAQQPEESEGVDYQDNSCPYCKKKIKSKSGRTLHVQTKHPDKLKEYHELGRA